MLKYISMLVAMCVVGGCSGQGCNEADVSREIIKDARPEMGDLEVEFWSKAIKAACTKHGLAVPLCVAKIAQESRFNQAAVSPAGAKCAAQIMPVHYKNFSEIKEIEACLDMGAKILAAEFKNCPSAERALRCYYSGPDNSKKGTLERVGPYDLKGYSDGVLARITKATAKACPAFNNLLVSNSK